MTWWEWLVGIGTFALLAWAVCVQRSWIGDLQDDNARLRVAIRDLRADAWRAIYGYGPRKADMVRIVAESDDAAIEALIADTRHPCA